MKMPEHREWADWIIRLRPVPGFAADPTMRMRRLLKAALRCYGFRAEDYYQPRQLEEIQVDMSPAQAQREFDRQEKSRAKFCGRCGEQRRQMEAGGVIVHRANCPILVALGIYEGKVLINRGLKPDE